MGHVHLPLQIQRIRMLLGHLVALIQAHLGIGRQGGIAAKIVSIILRMIESELQPRSNTHSFNKIDPYRTLAITAFGDVDCPYPNVDGVA